MPLRQALAARHCHLLSLGFSCITPAELHHRHTRATDKIKAAAAAGK